MLLRVLGFIIMFSIFIAIILSMHYSIYSFFISNKMNLFWVCIISSLTLFIIFAISHIFTNALFVYLKQLSNFYLGSLFIFFVLSLIFRLINLFLKVNKTYLGIFFLIVGILLVLYATFNAFSFKNNTFTVQTDKIEKDMKIAHISDLHIGSNNAKSLEKIVDYIKIVKPDVVFITGDLIDEMSVKQEDLKSINTIKVPIYFIYGNHEHYMRKGFVDELFKDLNMTILRNELVDLGSIQIIGFDDRANITKELNKVNINSSKFSILLNHQPKGVELVKNKGFDLMLSGHTHSGQIWPFGYLVRLQFKYVSGFYNLDNFYLNVNPGTGTWGPKMRLGTSNEVSIIELKKK